MRIPQQRISSETLWAEANGFPGYSVSNTGLVRSDKYDRLLREQSNQAGLIYVGVTKGRAQHNLSVALLVAHSFLPPHPNTLFRTPINLDGNRRNNHVQNLMWRPRWFAVRYHRQFINPPDGTNYPIEDLHTLEQFDDVWDAVTRYGLLFKEVLINATSNHIAQASNGVWPTGQQFRYIKTHTIPQQYRSL